MFFIFICYSVIILIINWSPCSYICFITCNTFIYIYSWIPATKYILSIIYWSWNTKSFDI